MPFFAEVHHGGEQITVKAAKLKARLNIRKIISVLVIVVVLFLSVRFIFLKPGEVSAADVLLSMDEGYGTSSSVNDTNGSVSAGSITNAVWQREDLCKSGKCLYFDGDQDYVSFADDADLDFAASDDFTIEGWFRRPENSGTADIIIAKYEDGVAGGYKVYMDSDGDIVFMIDDDGTWDSVDIIGNDQSKNFDDNKWHHFAAVKDGTTAIYLYVDGNLIDQDTNIVETGTLENSASFYIGINSDATSNDWVGFIDEVKIMRTARTAAEIKADFNRGTPDRGSAVNVSPDQDYISDGLVGHWKLDETTGTLANDSSGNSNTGTITAGTGGYVSGKFGTAYNFDGSATIIDAGSGSSLDELPTNGMSISAWFYALSQGEGGGAAFIMAKNTSEFQSAGWYLRFASTRAISFSVDGSGDLVRTTSNSAFNLNTWNHVSVQWDGNITDASSVHIYINGVEGSYQTTTNGLARTNDSASKFWIGNSSNNLRTFDGYIDDVRVYNRTLSTSELRNLYNWAPGPVGYWKLDENSAGSSAVTRNDSSGYGNNLTDNNTVPSGIGKFGSSAFFTSGNSERLSISDGNQTGLDITGSITMCAWFKQSAVSSLNDIAAKFATTGNQKGYQLFTFNNNIYFWLSNDGSTANEAFGGTSLALNTWYHTCAVYNGTDMRIYLNGKLDNNGADNPKTYSSGIFNSTASFYIGRSDDADYFDGNVDEVKVYNYARSQSQVIEDMNGGHPAPGSPVGSPVAYWKIDEGYGTNVNDSSVNDNDLTMNSASWTNDGKFNKAWNGTGGDIRMSRSTDSDLEFSATEDFSVSLWFKSDSATNPAAAEYLVNDGAAAGSAGYAVYANTSGFICFGIDDDTSWGPDVASCSTTDFYDGTWHHVLAVRDVTLDKTFIYIDAREKDSDTDSTSATLDSSPTFFVGDIDTDNAGSGEEFAGDVDEIKVFRLALTSDQAKVDYNRGKAVVYGALSTESGGAIASDSYNRELCLPGDTSTCNAPVAEWKMDENTGTTLQDSSGNGYTSTTWTGNARYVPGQLGSGLYFDGANDVVRIDPAASSYLDTIGGTSDSYSITAWFNTYLTANTDQSIVYKRGSGANTYPFTLAVGGSPKEISFILNDGTTTCQSNSGTVLVNDGKWHFVAAVWDTTTNTTYVYVDGVLLDKDVCSGDPGSMANVSDISIGNGRNHTTDGDYFFHDFYGYLDQIRIYNYARTGPQVAWEYNHGKPTINWWKLDDNVSGNGATIGNSALSSLWNISGTTVNGGSNLDCTIEGKRNYGCDLDGTNDNINMGNQSIYNALFLDNRDFSVAGWFNRDTFTTDDTIVGRKPTQDANDEGWLVFIDADTDLLTLKLADGVDTYTVESSSTFTSTGWNHFVIVWDDDTEGNINMYINGKVETVTKTGTLADIGNYRGNTRNFRIGIEHDGTDNPFDGKVDDIMLFGHTLSVWEVKNIYTQGAVRFGPITGTP